MSYVNNIPGINENSNDFTNLNDALNNNGDTTAINIHGSKNEANNTIPMLPSIYTYTLLPNGSIIQTLVTYTLPPNSHLIGNN